MLKETKIALEEFSRMQEKKINTDICHFRFGIRVPKLDYIGKKLYFVDKNTDKVIAFIPLEYTLVRYFIFGGYSEYNEWIVTMKTPNGIICRFAHNIHIYETLENYNNPNFKPSNLINKKLFLGNMLIEKGFSINTSSNSFYIYGWVNQKGSDTPCTESKECSCLSFNKYGLNIKFNEKPNLKIYDTKEEAFAESRKREIVDFEEETQSNSQKDFIVDLRLIVKHSSIEDVKSFLKDTFEENLSLDDYKMNITI